MGLWGGQSYDNILAHDMNGARCNIKLTLLGLSGPLLMANNFLCHLLEHRPVHKEQLFIDGPE